MATIAIDKPDSVLKIRFPKKGGYEFDPKLNGWIVERRIHGTRFQLIFRCRSVLEARACKLWEVSRPPDPDADDPNGEPVKLVLKLILDPVFKGGKPDADCIRCVGNGVYELAIRSGRKSLGDRSWKVARLPSVRTACSSV